MRAGNSRKKASRRPAVAGLLQAGSEYETRIAAITKAISATVTEYIWIGAYGRIAVIVLVLGLVLDWNG
jgi:hypothetical protein